MLTPINKTDLLNMLNGKTLETIPLSTLENKLVAESLSIYFNKTNEATGKFSKKPANDPQNDTGTWTVQNDGKLCITWKHWFNAKPFCDYVYDAKNSVIFIDADGKFVSVALKKNIM